MGARGRVWLTIFSLGVSPLISYLALRSARRDELLPALFTLYSIITDCWLPPVYSLLYDLVLPRMRGITSSIYIIISDACSGLGMGPYFVGIVSDKNGGDLARRDHLAQYRRAGCPIVVCLFIVLVRIEPRRASDGARPGAGWGQNLV